MDRKLWCSGLVWALEFALVFGVAATASAQNKSEKSAGAGAASPLAGLGAPDAEMRREECRVLSPRNLTTSRNAHAVPTIRHST